MAGVGVGTLTAVRIKIGVVADDTGVGGDNARSAEEIFDIIDGGAAGGEHGDALAAEEDVFVLGVASGVGFGEDVGARAVPIKLAADFGNATTVDVIVDTANRPQLAFRVPRVGIDAVVLGVAGGVVGKDGEMVVAVGGGRKAAFLGAAGVVRVGGRSDGLQIAPGVDIIGFFKAVGGTRRVITGGRASDAIELVVREVLSASGVEIVEDIVDVARVEDVCWEGE